MSDRHGHDDHRSALERTFGALPPARGRGFARTWWGQSWVKALEDTALDGEQLKKGRRYAREGAVGAVSVRPGRITAVVQDRDRTTYRSDVLLQELSEDHWDRLLDTVADRAGHIAALLDRDMPPHLVEDASAAGVELLPGIGDLVPDCTCDDWDHCGHTAALCYQVARLLDQDPFVLLLLRGRGERELLSELQVRSAARAARSPEGPQAEPPGTQDGAGRAEPEGVPARVGAPPSAKAVGKFATRDLRPPLPAPWSPEDHSPAFGTGNSGRPPVPGGGTDPGPGLDVAALEFLAADAAARARQLLADALSPGHERSPVPAELTPWQDAVRLAARGPNAGITARLAAGSGRDRDGLALAVRAWEQGGPAALAVLEEEWDPEPEALARARAQLSAAWTDDERAPRLRAAGNRWTVVGAEAQLRYGRDGRWWPYRREHGRWRPAGPADHDPATALAALTALLRRG